MAYLYRQGLKVVGNRDRSIITPDTTPPVVGSWRERVDGVGENSQLIFEKWDGTVWEIKRAVS